MKTQILGEKTIWYESQLKSGRKVAGQAGSFNDLRTKLEVPVSGEMQSLWHFQQSWFWNLELPLTMKKKARRAGCTQSTWADSMHSVSDLFSQHIRSPSCISKQEAILVLSPTLHMRNGSIFGLFPLGKKKAHSKLSPVPCLWLISGSSLQATLARTTQLSDLAISE